MSTQIYEIDNVDDSRLYPYAKLTEAELRQSVEEANGIFIAESPKVIDSALDAGYEPLSLLCESRHIDGDARHIIDRMGTEIPVYTGARDVLAAITGYRLTRGVLCAMKRKPLPGVAETVADKRRVAVIDGVCDTTNIGAIFRAASGLGIDAVLLTPTACDPLNRRSVRVSMGTVFNIPWTRIDGSLTQLHRYGYKIAALALRAGAVRLDDAELNACHRLALVFGTEGDGLSDRVIDEADYTVIIPMHHGTDSLNVASAAAVTFWQLRVDG